MATPDSSGVQLPYDPLIDIILSDARTDKALMKSLQSISQAIIPYRHTLHPSDQLLDAWYRFKENQPCQR